MQKGLVRRHGAGWLVLAATVLAMSEWSVHSATSSDARVRPGVPAPFGQAGPPVASLDPVTWRKAQEIADRALIIDAHAHDPYKAVSQRWPQQITPALLAQGRPDGLVQAVPLSPAATDRPVDTILADIRAIKSRMDGDGRAALALTAADFGRLQQAGRAAVMLTVESFQGPLDARVDTLDTYYREGVRVIGLSPGGKDPLIDGGDDAPTLSAFGRQVVARMNQLGLACDVTHLPANVRRDVADASRAPILASHSAAVGAVASGFNLSDELLDRIAARKGLIGVTFCSEQISRETLAMKGREPDPTKLPPARIEDLVDQIDYLRKRVGLDAVALGSDYGGSGRMAPAGLSTAEGLPLVVYHLLKRNYTEKDIAQVLGGNFVRYMERVERSADARAR